MDASGHISRSRDPDICLSEYILVEADLLLFFAGAPRAALHLSGSLFHDHLKAVGTTGSHWQCARPLIAWRPFAWRAYSRNGIPRQLEVIRLEQEIKFIKLHKDKGNVSLVRLCRPIPASSAIDRHPSLRTQYEWAKVWHKKSLTRCQEFKSAPKMDGFLSVLRDTDANDNDKDENSQCAGFHEDILTEDHRIVRKVQRTPRGGQRGRRRRGSGSTPHTDHSQEGIRRLRSGRTIARVWLHQRITGIDKVLAWARVRRAGLGRRCMPHCGLRRRRSRLLFAERPAGSRLSLPLHPGRLQERCWVRPQACWPPRRWGWFPLHRVRPKKSRRRPCPAKPAQHQLETAGERAGI